jgi:DHA1 family bicyclomycin/chloramphenicol resistance-like MFS transporter
VGGFTSPLVGIGGGRTAVPMGTTMVVAAVAGLVVFALVWRRAPATEDAGDPGTPGAARATAARPSDN